MDNCPAHKITRTFSNIEIMFFPPNSTRILQPMDREIIHSFKSKFNNYKLSFILNKFEKGESVYNAYKKLTLRDTFIFADLFWNKVTQSTILNCFKHLHNNQNGHVNYEKIPDYKCYIKSLNIHDPITEEEFINIEYTENDKIMSEFSMLNIDSDSGLDEQFQNDKIIDTSVIKTTREECIHSFQIVEKFLYKKKIDV
ncbi:hypothetical protein A3Q56_08356 [Intoshia linei]|uniref:DDE-1 domain-containing protein n=1 Tax=Intoshia linei TaxID=1819745 RepID=A0A177AQ09_9BILA|nr:hypothetical protein A3Q56_08356 [Intoshia linei]